MGSRVTLAHFQYVQLVVEYSFLNLGGVTLSYSDTQKVVRTILNELLVSQEIRLGCSKGKLFINESMLIREELPDFIEAKSEQGSMKTVPQCANEPVPFGNKNCIKYQSLEKLENGKTIKF